MWKDAIEELERKREQSYIGGGQEKINKQHASGKLTARERLEVLFDAGTFVEVDNFIESRINDFDLDKKRVPGDGVITGYGQINGRLTFAYAEDFTVMGGTLGEYHSIKICRIQDMAYKMKSPIVMINDSGGARIEEGISALSGYSGIFLRNTKASGVIPQIAVILGPCSGGACYSPAICDFIFIVKKSGKMFITGPQVVKTVTNETTTIDELGGAEIHAKKSGVTHFIYEDEVSCLTKIRTLLTYLPNNYLEKPPVLKPKVQRGSLLKLINKAVKVKNITGKYDNLTDTVPKDGYRDLIDIIPDNKRKPYDILLVINRIVDSDTFMEVQSGFAQNAVIGLGRIAGETVGIVANQPLIMAGSIDIDASDKIARFIRTCDCFNIPLVTLVDVPAFYPGVKQEHNGIIRHGAKILYAFSEATVPKISVILRKAYGGAYIAMNSMNMGADIVYAWPIAEIAVMGAEGAVNIIFKKDINNSDAPEEMTAKYIDEYNEKFMNPYIAARYGFVTEVIKPEETREKLIQSLNLLKNKQVECIPKKHGNIPL